MTQYTGKTKILLNTTGSNGCSTELTETCEDFVVPAAAILEEEPAAQSNAGGNSVENGVSGQGEDTEGQYTGLDCIPAKGTPEATNSASLSMRLSVLRGLVQ